MRPLVGLLCLVASSGPPVVAADPVVATARVAAGPHYVGQGVEVRVEVGGAGSSARPTIEAPVVAGAEVRPVAAESDPSARLLVIPRRPGVVDLPAIRTRRGDWSGSTRPVRLKILAVPAAGRGPAFLGGVGPFEVRAEVEPATVRAGQALEYRLVVSGPAAWGSARAPDLASWAKLSPGFRVEPGEASGPSADGNPPTRTFRYRLRPSQGGRITLPPVPVAAFDPARNAFATRFTAGIPVVVEEIPRFDPSRLVDDRRDEKPTRLVEWVAVIGALVNAAVMVGVVLARRRRRAARRVDPARLAAELARGLDPGSDGPEAARRITEAVAAWLGGVGGRPEGVLTPPEAAESVERLTRDSGLAGRARRLIERCDRARFGGRGEGAPVLVAEAKGVLEAMGRAMPRGKSGEARPREAVETAGSR